MPPNFGLDSGGNGPMSDRAGAERDSDLEAQSVIRPKIAADDQPSHSSMVLSDADNQTQPPLLHSQTYPLTLGESEGFGNPQQTPVHSHGSHIHALPHVTGGIASVP